MLRGPNWPCGQYVFCHTLCVGSIPQETNVEGLFQYDPCCGIGRKNPKFNFEVCKRPSRNSEKWFYEIQGYNVLIHDSVNHAD